MSSPSQRPAQHAHDARIAAQEARIDWLALEGLVHVDPAGRSLASFRRAKQPLDAGQLRAAALDLARRADAVGIVTGFCAVAEGRVTAETDGPPGALLLAQVLLAAGADVWLISDSYGLPLLRAGCELFNLNRNIVVEFPFDTASTSQSSTDVWLEEFFARGTGSRLTHLVAIERPGPSHTLESTEKQPHTTTAAHEQFLAAVPPRERDVCHNMRGDSIDRWTAKTHRLFEWITGKQLPIPTIGIGDGGNEIGMGRFAWETIVEAVGSPAAAKITCRIATDFAIIGGVSNWAAYALALAVARLRGVPDRDGQWTAESQRKLVRHLVESAGAVDGITLRPDATVDGLPLDVYLEPLVAMRKLLGFEY